METIYTIRPYTLDMELSAAILEHWLPAHALKAGQTRLAKRLLFKAGTSLGVINASGNFPVNTSTRSYQETVIKEAYDSQARMVLPIYTPAIRWCTRQKKKDLVLKGLFPSEIRAMLDLNLASESELKSLPGFGEKSTRKLLLYRQNNPLIGDWEELRKATGFSKSQIETLQEYAFIGTGLLASSDTEIHEQLYAGGMKVLLQLIVSKKLVVPEVKSENTEDILMALLDTFTCNILQKGQYPQEWRPSMERLARGSRYLERFKKLESASSIAGVSYISGSTYLSFLKTLLAGAKEKIYVNMFFFHLEGEQSPINEIYKLLVDANKRGLDVKLVIGSDAEGDYHNARLVNENIFRELDNDHIKYRKSYDEVTNHSKMVIVDDLHVLCGSHNWTISSLYIYQETSFYVQSVEFNAQVVAQYMQYWNLLATEKAEREIELVSLEVLSRANRDLLATKQITNTNLFLEATISPDEIENTSQKTGIDKEHLLMIRGVILLMKEYKIAEITAVALVCNGIRTVDDLLAASDEELTNAFAHTDKTPEPFRSQALPQGIVKIVKKLIA